MNRDVKMGDGVATVIEGDTVISLWKSPASVARWRWQRTHIDAARQAAGSVICVSLILSSSDPPDATLRRIMQNDFKEMGADLRQFVVVPLGDTLWISVVRALVKTALLLTGQSKQQSVAATLAEAIDRIQTLATPKTPSPTALRTTFATLGAALGVTTLA